MAASLGRPDDGCCESATAAAAEARARGAEGAEKGESGVWSRGTLAVARPLTAAEEQRVALAARKGWIAACHARRVEAGARTRAREWLSGAAPAAREMRATILRAAEDVVFTPVSGSDGGAGVRDEL